MMVDYEEVEIIKNIELNSKELKIHLFQVKYLEKECA